MGDLVKSDIINTYDCIKRQASKAVYNKRYEKGLDFIRLAANIAYNFNFFYKDDQLEDLLTQVGSNVLPQNESYSCISGRFVFYDYFGMENKGLTQQYLRALISRDCEFLYILEEYSKYSDGILSELKKYNKVKVVIIDSNLTLIQKIQFAYKEITNYKPEFSLLHLHPASVVAVTLWNMLPQVKRYQINLTDHAFWLGVKCIDYCLEFRNYGASVTLQKRGFSRDRILIQPFYPITDCQPFIGLPEFPIDAVLILTGGAYYKMYGDNNAFFNIVKEILDQNPKAILLIAGNGDSEPLCQFILENQYHQRIFLIGNRSDINYVFEKCDIYLSTYPITGGLMSQFAAVNNKPILSYSTPDIPSNNVESFLTFGNHSSEKITFHNLPAFLNHAKSLIENKSKRIEYGERLKSRIIDINSFNELLHKNIILKKENNSFSEVDIDYNRFYNLYLEVENKFLPTYRKLIISNFKLATIFLSPKIAFSLKTLGVLIKRFKRRN